MIPTGATGITPTWLLFVIAKQHCRRGAVLAEAYVALQHDLHNNGTHGTASSVTWILQRNATPRLASPLRRPRQQHSMTLEIADGVLPLAKNFSVMHHHAGERTTDATHCLAARRRPLAWHFLVAACRVQHASNGVRHAGKPFFFCTATSVGHPPTTLALSTGSLAIKAARIGSAAGSFHRLCRLPRLVEARCEMTQRGASGEVRVHIGLHLGIRRLSFAFKPKGWDGGTIARPERGNARPTYPASRIELLCSKRLHQTGGRRRCVEMRGAGGGPLCAMRLSCQGSIAHCWLRDLAARLFHAAFQASVATQMVRRLQQLRLWSHCAPLQPASFVRNLQHHLWPLRYSTVDCVALPRPRGFPGSTAKLWLPLPPRMLRTPAGHGKHLLGLQLVLWYTSFQPPSLRSGCPRAGVSLCARHRLPAPFPSQPPSPAKPWPHRPMQCRQRID